MKSWLVIIIDQVEKEIATQTFEPADIIALLVITGILSIIIALFAWLLTIIIDTVIRICSNLSIEIKIFYRRD